MGLLGLLIGLLLLPSSVWAQGDEFAFPRALLVNSPVAIKDWPITAHITGVHFEMQGWRVDFDRRLGAQAWPNMQSPNTGGTDTLQYTLGLCKHIGPSWTCSAVVQFWQTRLDEEGVRAGAPPSEIAKEWFYDASWGALAGWQPRVGEEVGVFIAAGDLRRTLTVYPGTVPQRTAARLLIWGTDLGPAKPTEPTDPKPEEPKPEEPKPDLPKPDEPSGGDVRALQDQIARLAAEIARRDDARATQIAAVDDRVRRHDEDPTVVRKFLSNRYVQLAIAAFGTYITQQQMTKP